LNGAVTQLSPYITHGFVSLPEVLAGVRSKYAVKPQDGRYEKWQDHVDWAKFIQKALL